MHSLGLCELVVLARAVTWFKHPNGPTNLRCEPVQGGCFALEVKHLLKPACRVKAQGRLPATLTGSLESPVTAKETRQQTECGRECVWRGLSGSHRKTMQYGLLFPGDGMTRTVTRNGCLLVRYLAPVHRRMPCLPEVVCSTRVHAMLTRVHATAYYHVVQAAGRTTLGLWCC